jgi:hypothetical protein
MTDQMPADRQVEKESEGRSGEQETRQSPVDPSINICFSTTDGYLSRWIRWVTRSPVSHALLTFYSQTLDKVMVMEATGKGFNLIPWNRWAKKNQLVARFALDVPRDKELEALHRIADKLGAEYDTVSLFGFFFRRWKKRGANPLDDPTKLICSEAVARFLQEVGIDAFQNPGEWTPADIFQYAMASDIFVKKEASSDYSLIEARMGKKRG